MPRRNPPRADSKKTTLLPGPTETDRSAAPVSARTNPTVRRLREARDGRDERSIFVEGARLVDELLKSPILPREAVITLDKHRDPRFQSLSDRLKSKGAAVHLVTDDVMAFLSGVDAPPGLAVRADRPTTTFPALAAPAPLIVLLDGVQNPANAGAVLRVAEAAGIDAVGTLAGTVDLLSPKSLRASSGSAFRLPLFHAATPRDLATLAAPGVSLLLADARGDRAYTEVDWTRPTVLVLGGEATGARTTFFEGLTTERIRIPMSGNVESLNVAVAAGVFLMEARRQRTPPRS